MDSIPPELSPEERARLARKGEMLYGKSCEAGGCAESFAMHQLRLGHVDVVDDLLRFLDGRIEVLRSSDPGGRLPGAEALAARIRRHREARGAGGSP